MALLFRPTCFTASKRASPFAATMIGRWSQPRSSSRGVILRRSFADKPGKPDAKAAAAKPAAGPPPPPPPPKEDYSPPKLDLKPGYDAFKIAPNTPADPNNPLHNRDGGLIGQNVNEIPAHVKNIADAITRLNLLEVAMLNKLLDDKIGVPDELFKQFLGAVGVPAGFAPAAAAAPGAPAAGAGAPGAPPAAGAKKAEEKKKEAFNLKLVKFEESSKITILKQIRLLRPGMNLAETKALIEKLPSILKDNVPKEEAESWVKKLKEVGATVELE